MTLSLPVGSMLPDQFWSVDHWLSCAIPALVQVRSTAWAEGGRANVRAKVQDKRWTSRFMATSLKIRRPSDERPCQHNGYSDEGQPNGRIRLLAHSLA